MKLLFRLIVFPLLFCLNINAAMAISSSQPLLQDERNTIAIYESLSKYAVFVHRYQRVMDRSMQVFDVPLGSGSGFIWNNQGFIVTNYHVVEGSKHIAINFDGMISKVKLVGADPRKDIAVLKVLSPNVKKRIVKLSPLSIMKSQELLVGQKAIAIGNPFGLDHSLSTGVISALGRTVPGNIASMRDMIQTDAAINPGNSGGPLFNSAGRLIGMNTAIFSKSGTSAGIGFAVPAEDIERAANQIIKNGRVILAGIGVERIEASIAKQLGIKQGVLVGDVIPGSPAAKAKLHGTYRDGYGRIHLGDIITGINQKRVYTFDDMYHIMSDISIGTPITLTINRNGKAYSLRLKTMDILKLSSN